MPGRSRAQLTLRVVLVDAVAALILGVAAVALLEIDLALARSGNELPQAILTLTRWFALALGVAALGLWTLERRRSHAPITTGVIIAIVAVIATPIAFAIAEPDDTPSSIVAFDAQTGSRRWANDVDLLFAGSPIRLDRDDRLVLYGEAPAGRCDTDMEQFTLARADGRQISHTTNPTAPSPEPLHEAPVSAGDVRLEIIQMPEEVVAGTGEVTTTPTIPLDGPIPNTPELRARDRAGTLLWSTLVDGDRLPPLIYADAEVVAAYVPDLDFDARTSGGAGPESVIGVFDARTGRRRWTIHPSAFRPPLFSRDRVFAIEGAHLVVHDTASGKVVERLALRAPVENYPDAVLRRSEPDGDIALAEGRTRRLTVFDKAGKVRWNATLPRAMPFPEVGMFGDSIYVFGGGKLGYVCGGE